MTQGTVFSKLSGFSCISYWAMLKLKHCEFFAFPLCHAPDDTIIPDELGAGSLKTSISRHELCFLRLCTPVVCHGITTTALINHFAVYNPCSPICHSHQNTLARSIWVQNSKMITYQKCKVIMEQLKIFKQRNKGRLCNCPWAHPILATFCKCFLCKHRGYDL